MATNITDPRPDLTEDSALWARLLALAAQNYPELTEPLITMRQNGTALKRLKNNTTASAYALRPIIKKSCWENYEAYKAKAAELLRPHHDQLINLLQNFAIQLNTTLSAGTQADRIRAHLDVHGYCAVRSGVLDGEVIYFARDAKAAAGVPKTAVVYTLDELRALVGVPGSNPPGPEGLKRLHFAKKTFDGTICGGEEVREGFK